MAVGMRGWLYGPWRGAGAGVEYVFENGFSVVGSLGWLLDTEEDRMPLAGHLGVRYHFLRGQGVHPWNSAYIGGAAAARINLGDTGVNTEPGAYLSIGMVRVEHGIRMDAEVGYMMFFGEDMKGKGGIAVGGTVGFGF